MAMVGEYTKALTTSFMLTIKEWPAWLGFAASEYVGQMVEDQFTGQNMWLRFIGRGIRDTQMFSYYWALKEPARAATEASGGMAGLQ